MCSQALKMSELKIPNSFQTSEQVGNLGTQQAAQTRHKRPPETLVERVNLPPEHFFQINESLGEQYRE